MASAKTMRITNHLPITPMDNLMPRTMFASYLILLAPIAFITLLGSALARDHDSEFVPEWNVFVKLSPQTRLFFLGDVTQGLSSDYTEGEIGAHIDFTLKPILRRALRDENWERDRYLWVRAGYVASGDLDDRDEEPFTQTILLEATGRLELFANFWIVNRGRVDFRNIDGQGSERYRYRLGIERECTVGSVALVPYIEAEIFYDSRFDTVNRQLYQAGVEIGLTKRWRIEPYVARQNDSRSAKGNVNRFGLILKSYF